MRKRVGERVKREKEKEIREIGKEREMVRKRVGERVKREKEKEIRETGKERERSTCNGEAWRERGNESST